MLDMARKALTKVEGKTKADFEEDENLEMALVYLIQTIGEAARKVSSDFQKAHPEIPWSQIVGMRHKVVHDYLHVNYNVVWQVVTQHLQPLVTCLEQFVPEA